MGLELLKEKLETSSVDLVAPETVVEELVSQLDKVSDGFVKGVVKPYKGEIDSYYDRGIMSAVEAFGRQEHDIQLDLGGIGYSYSKFELFLTASKLPQYKFRVLFFGYDIGGYPVKVTLEKGVADSIASPSYIRVVKNRAELEDLLTRVLCSSRIVEIMQGLINASIISQSSDIMATKPIEAQEGLE